MIFKRKIYSQLLDWKNNTNGSKALLIEGARRIGKSTIVEEFAKQHYQSYILINFAFANQKIKDAFNNHLNDLNTFFMILSSEYATTLYNRKSLVIFDEVQRFPKAREAIKLLVQDGRYDYIETGSLISIKENVKDIVIPSEERAITMNPLDFEEFCMALGQEGIVKHIKDCFERKIPLCNELHETAMLLFKQYMLIGGMPKPLAEFIENNKQFEIAELEKEDILKNYRDDINKIDRNYKGKVAIIFDQIPAFLSKHEKRVVISDTNKNDRITKYYDTFYWLEDSRICNMCFKCNDPDIALSLNEEKTFLKCYLNDTGLLLTHAFGSNKQLKMEMYAAILRDNLNINKGMLYENIIAQMLTANNHKLYFYTHYNASLGRNDTEVDFLLTDGNRTNLKLFPIEVKSTKKYKYESLSRFCEKFKDRIGQAYIIHPKNLSITPNNIICIPPYMAFCLKPGYTNTKDYSYESILKSIKNFKH